MNDFRLHYRYTRSDPRGGFPQLVGIPEIEHNRLAAFWRPAIDLTPASFAPMRLQFAAPVAEWIEDADEAPTLWFAMVGVAGLRHQVIRHSGLAAYDSRRPADLAPELRTPAWERLLEAIERFEELDARRRIDVVFQLAQLSYIEYIREIAPLVQPDGDPQHDRYAYEVARVHVRYPGRGFAALDVFRRLSTEARDPVLALLACFQGISHSIRLDKDIEHARRFEARGRALVAGPDYPDTWHGALVHSRFHRALALLRMNERDLPAMRAELHRALEIDAGLTEDAHDELDRQIALENRRILLEAQIKASARDPEYSTHVDVAALCERILEIDPNCVEVRNDVGEGYFAIGDLPRAAEWFTRAGELGTGAGALGWYRAGQCYDLLGDRWAAANAMGRCLELDATAVEPRAYLQRLATKELQPA